ncbi:MAG: V-type ATP synthase subunit F [Actinobacteria bacterium]|nr:V-type ATP synthase subunit F [Actinomycetota bacterium]
MEKAKIAALGEKDIMLIFQGIGADIFPVKDTEEVEMQLKKIIRDEYGIIFITETLAIKLDSIIREYYDKVKPSIVIIPSLGKRNNYAVETLRHAIIKAVGTDVFS